jgi:hypothetical protein
MHPLLLSIIDMHKINRGVFIFLPNVLGQTRSALARNVRLGAHSVTVQIVVCGAWFGSVFFRFIKMDSANAFDSFHPFLPFLCGTEEIIFSHASSHKTKCSFDIVRTSRPRSFSWSLESGELIE